MKPCIASQILLVAVVAFLGSGRGSAQQVLLLEDFSNGFPPSWVRYDGSASVSSGVLNLGSGCVVLPGTYSRSGGLAIEADVSITWGAAGDFNIFAFFDLYNPAVPHCLYITTSGYGFNVYPVGSDNPQNFVDAVIAGMLDRSAVPAITPASTWTRVRAEIAADGELRLLLDGQEQTTNRDVVLPGGPVVLRTWGDVLIDNVRIETMSTCGYGPSSLPIGAARGTAKPSTSTTTWDSCGGPGTLRLDNFGASSVVVTLNEAVVVYPGDLNPSVSTLQFPIILSSGSNELVIEVRGKPGTNVAVSLIPG